MVNRPQGQKQLFPTVSLFLAAQLKGEGDREEVKSLLTEQWKSQKKKEYSQMDNKNGVGQNFSFIDKYLSIEAYWWWKVFFWSFCTWGRASQADNESPCWNYDLRNFWSFCGCYWAPCTSICYHRTDLGLAFDCLPAQSLLCRNHAVFRKRQTPQHPNYQANLRCLYCKSNSNMLKNTKIPKSQFSSEGLAFNCSVPESPLVFCNNLHLTLSTLYKTVQLLR